jgi:hypothetical protein
MTVQTNDSLNSGVAVNASFTSGGPIFIGGLFKSGTTLLRAMLGQHRDIHSGLETQWAELNWPVDGTNPLQTSHLQRLQRFFDMPQREMARLTEASRSVEEFIGGFMKSAAHAAGKTRWCEKTPQNILYVDRILRSFPSSVMVHVVRDPRDVLASMYEANRHDWVNDYARMWCSSVGENERRHAAGAFDRGRFFRLRYEDLVLKTDATMRTLLSVIGAAWDPAAAVFEGRGADFELVKSVVGKESTTLRRLQDPMEQGRIGLARILPDGLSARIAKEVADRGYSCEFDAVIWERAAVTGPWPSTSVAAR